MASFFTPHLKGYLNNVELNTYGSFSRLNTRFTSPQTCHMLPLDQIKHRSSSGSIQESNSFDFYEWAYKEWLDALNKSLAKDVCHANQLLPWIAQRRGTPYKWGCINTYLRKSNMFNSFLSLQNLFSSNGLVNMSASWSSVPTLSMQISPFYWWSLMK